MLRTVRNPLRKRRKMVILHNVAIDESAEGIWDGRVVAGHYRIETPTLVGKANRRSKLPGALLVPKENVAFIQVLAEDAT